MFQFRAFPTYAYFIQRTLMRYCRTGFPHSEIYGSNAYVPLPVAYRSLSRPSSAPGAKASTLRSFLLDHFRVYSVTHWSGLFALCFGVLSYLKDNRLFRCLEYFLSIGFNVQFSRNNLQTFA